MILFLSGLIGNHDTGNIELRVYFIDFFIDLAIKEIQLFIFTLKLYNFILQGQYFLRIDLGKHFLKLFGNAQVFQNGFHLINCSDWSLAKSLQRGKPSWVLRSFSEELVCLGVELFEVSVDSWNSFLKMCAFLLVSLKRNHFVWDCLLYIFYLEIAVDDFLH